MSQVLLAVITDGLDRAALHRFDAQLRFLIVGRLLANVGDTLIVIAGEEVRSGLTAKVAIDAVAVDVELAGHILFIFFVNIGHNSRGAYMPTAIYD